VISGGAYVIHTCAGGSVWRMLISAIGLTVSAT